VCGALGFCGITALIGLILGIVATVKIKNSRGRLTGNGLAIAGICVSGFMLLICIPLMAIMAGMMLPALAKAKERAQTIQCVNNVKQLALAVRIYSTDHDEKFPPSSTWCDAIKTEAGTEKIFKCPAAKSNERCSYAFNSKLNGLNETNIAPDTVMIFETTGGWNVSGGRELMLTSSRHGRRYVVGFADGSVQELNESQLNDLRWDP
jgi:prepilin-type processing-associated H-X9-DG protein